MIEWVVIASSVCLNIFLIWYTRSTLYNLLYLSENLGNLRDIVTDFKEHLSMVYELERFYGDSTLTDLLEHSNLVTVELDKYDEIFLLTEPIEQEVEPDEQEET